MDKVALRSALIFLSGFVLMDAHIIVLLLRPEIAKIKCDLWLDKSFSQAVTVQWYLYGMGRYGAELVWAIAFSKIANLVSFRLYKVSLIFVLCFVTQFWFYCWNRNSSMWANFWVYLCMVCAIIYILIPEKEKKESKYRRIDS